MITDISYKEYKKSSDIHGTVLYPAVMVAPVQKDILEELIQKNNELIVFDPFHGSGTALYEAMEISKDIKLIGCDINPLANLITKVKLQGVTKTIVRDINLLEEYLQEDLVELHSFNNIEKWFRSDIIEDLSKIKQSIQKIKSKKNRQFFWCMMSDVIRHYSNTRSSTYKLYSKKNKAIEKMQNNVIKDYIKSINSNYPKYMKSSNNFKLHKKDVLKVIKNIDDNYVDISITSPPYGENATTVTYGQFSSLILYWIDARDLIMEGWELDNYSIIDRKSLGGEKKNLTLTAAQYTLLNTYLNKICIEKHNKVKNFFIDYFIFLDELCRTTKDYIVLTLGNRTVDGINIDLTDISKRYLSLKGFIILEVYEREIPTKRTPKKLKFQDNLLISSMNNEYVIISKKIKSST